ncbi:little elongation complex subunit 1 isoform X2 [Austrofundulus limnaeus]|uniref:Little elongation complex subunit 1 isoform X2 n=1 Tax=Austrofundulus limnaeus TaxID=52670 RepID=A0A2I4ATQ1_AUSLI|nr:PREDICTED: little elongation complex subunit 1 isoform X2 [Austrofundulus limnaeus]
MTSRLKKLERERSKECRSTVTQTRAPAEPKVDKEKVRVLLQSLWSCVEPETEQSANLLHLPEPISKHVLRSSPKAKQKSNPSRISLSASQTSSGADSHLIQAKASDTPSNSSPQREDVTKHQASPQRFSGKKGTGDCNKRKRSSKQQKLEDSLPKNNNTPEVSFDAILELFKPMPPCISPLQDLEEVAGVIELDSGDKKSHPESFEDSHFLKPEESVDTISLSTHNSPKSVLQKQKNVDLMDVTTQEYQHVSKEKDLEQNRLCAVANQTDKPHKNCEKGTLPKEKTASLLSSSSVNVEDSHLNAESLIVSCIRSTNSSGADNDFEVAKQDHLDNDTNMDIDSIFSSSSLDTAVVTADGEESIGGRDAVAISGETENVVSKSSESFLDDGVTKNVPEVEKSHLDSCQSSADTTALKLPENTEWPECTQSSSSDSTSGVSNINLEEMLENTDGIQVCGETDGIAAQKTANIDVTVSDPNIHSKLTSFNKSPLFRKNTDELHSDEGYTGSSSETLLQMDVETEKTISEATSNSAPLVSNSPEEVTVDCTSFEKNTHSVCRQLSPMCLLPIVEPQTLMPDPEKCNSDVDIEHTVKNEETPIPHEDIMETESVKQLSLASTESGCTSSCIKETSATDGQPECSDTHETMHEVQSSPTNIEGKCSSEGVPAAAQAPEFIGHVRSEMGPPLPPVLTPLSTPPKAGKSINPRHAIGKLSFPSPMERVASPTTPTQVHIVPNSEEVISSSLNSPTPSSGVLSSPLQFGSATPKHALPVPGRLPSKAHHSPPSASASPPQENSMRILDSMYPELSARARTLSILRGNVGLNIGSSESGTLPTTSDNQASGFKTISSSSTAFTKTEMRGEKRPAVSLPQPDKRKCPKLGSSSADVTHEQVPSLTKSSGGETTSPQAPNIDQFKSSTPPLSAQAAEQDLLVNALEKIKNQCFDLLPVVKSHLYVGNLPKKPVLRDEEKEVISEICKCSSSQVDDMIMAILNKLKSEKTVLSSNYTQALCRVYTAICRQKKWWEKAHILAYSILIEDFPDSAKLVLFMVTTWPTVLSHSSLLCQAIHSITRLKAQEELLSCLSTFLRWEKNPSCNIEELIFRTLTELQSGSNQSFTKHTRYGEDLGAEAWEQIFTLHILCSQKKWKWTYEHVLSNVLWPIMNTWVTQPRDRQEPVSDMTVATVLRLIGRLCQLGLKEICVSSVDTVANIINTFLRHGQTEGVPWEVQLAAVYCIYDLSPCNPKQALEALAEWRGEITQHVPPAVTSCINQIASIGRQVKS